MKNVLLLVHDDTGQEARLQAALDLTRALSGHLYCLDVAQVPVLADGFGGASIAILMEDEREREASNRSKTEPRLAAEGVSWSWTEKTGFIPDCIIEASRT